MGWLDIDPASIRHILLTHQDTDHIGAVETDSAVSVLMVDFPDTGG